MALTLPDEGDLAGEGLLLPGSLDDSLSLHHVVPVAILALPEDGDHKVASNRRVVVAILEDGRAAL